MAEERQEIVALVAGAGTVAVIKGIDEGWFIAHPEYGRKFPYENTVPILPPLDDWLILAIPAVVTIAGIATKKPSLKYFGLGGLLFQGANIIRIIAIRAINHKMFGFATRNYNVQIAPPIKEI